MSSKPNFPVKCYFVKLSWLETETVIESEMSENMDSQGEKTKEKKLEKVLLMDPAC